MYLEEFMKNILVILALPLIISTLANTTFANGQGGGTVFDSSPSSGGWGATRGFGDKQSGRIKVSLDGQTIRMKVVDTVCWPTDVVSNFNVLLFGEVSADGKKMGQVGYVCANNTGSPEFSKAETFFQSGSYDGPSYSGDGERDRNGTLTKVSRRSECTDRTYFVECTSSLSRDKIDTRVQP